MTNKKKYPFIEEFKIPTLGADGKVRFIPATKHTPSNALIPIINKDEPIRYTFAKKKARLRLIRETGSDMITISPNNKIN